MLCIDKDIDQTEHVQKLIDTTRLLKEMAVAANESQSIEEALAFTLEKLCLFTGCPIGHVFLVSHKPGAFESRILASNIPPVELSLQDNTSGGSAPLVSGQWHVQGEDTYLIFREATEQRQFPCEAGLLMRVLDTRKPVWVADLMKDPGFKRAPEAEACGLKSGFAFPVLAGHEPVALLEFFSPAQTTHDLDLMSVLEEISGLLGRVFERTYVNEQLRATNSLLEGLFESAPDAILLVDSTGRIEHCNGRVLAVFGYTPEELIDQTVEVLVPARFHARHRFDRQAYSVSPVVRSMSAVPDIVGRRKDGSEFPIDISLSPLEGKPGQVICIIRDATMRRQAEIELRDKEMELAEVRRHLNESVEAERLHLAQDLHDGPIQDLYGLTYLLTELIDATAEQNKQAQIAAAREKLLQTIQTLRYTASELRPPALANFGLQVAIRSHAEQFQQNHPHPVLRLELSPDRRLIPESIRLSLFRIYQSLLSNIVRHAKAQHATVRFTLDHEQAILEVEDDGVGFDVPRSWVTLARRGHMGLAGIDERVEALGGQFTVTSQPGKGTLARISVPIHRLVPD